MRTTKPSLLAYCCEQRVYQARLYSFLYWQLVASVLSWFPRVSPDSTLPWSDFHIGTDTLTKRFCVGLLLCRSQVIL